MNICYLDAFSGISGDMTVGALLDAGADVRALTEGLASLQTGAMFRVEKVRRFGIAATKFHVDLPDEGAEAHRHLSHIVEIINGSAALPAPVKQMSIDLFTRLGETEASVHGQAIDQVHFHEVGAVDSICDIVGASICRHSLGIDEVFASPLNVGSGTVKTEHGVLPVPAPATALLLLNKPVYADGPAMELTTPTGATIASVWAKSFGPAPAMSIRSVGYGAGDRDFPQRANVLRVLVGERSAAAETTSVVVIEANIDDASPQVLGYAMNQLFAAGALDVTLQPIFMKKNRQGTLLSAMVRPEDREAMAALILRETTTIGLRFHSAERRVLERRWEEVDTPWGKVRVKITGHGFAPEYDDARALAEAQKIPLKEVLAAASQSWLNSQR
jgi:pyridinium-3,5-bisthiocarboxylic acid mononucleotide nickel chelatase